MSHIYSNVQWCNMKDGKIVDPAFKYRDDSSEIAPATYATLVDDTHVITITLPLGARLAVIMPEGSK